jgi:hypothetical protein
LLRAKGCCEVHSQVDLGRGVSQLCMMNQPLAVHISSASIALTSVPMISGSGVLEFRASTMISLDFGIVVDRDQIQARNMPELITKFKSSQ